LALVATFAAAAVEDAPVPSTASVAAAATPSGFVWRRETNGAFRVGESITYVIKYGVVPAGFATMEIPGREVVGGRDAYHLRSLARSNKGMDALFKVRDRNESWLDAESLCSLRFRQEIREGLYRREGETTYDHAAGTFRYWKRRKGKEFVAEGSMPAFVQDVLSSLYYLRTRDLEVGRTYGLEANSAATNWPLAVHVRSTERISVPAGTFDCWRLEPALAGEGLFQAKGKLEVWVTRDERKVPVLLRSKVAVGAFDAEMTKYVEGGRPDTPPLPAERPAEDDPPPPPPDPMGP
jgi:hypothetical protein